MGLLDKLLNKDDGKNSGETGDWLAKLDEQVEHTIETGATTDQAKIPAALGGSMDSGKPKGDGPMGDVAEHLDVLHALPGSTWREVAQAYAEAKAELGPNPPRELIRRVNSAYAALRVKG